MATLSSYELLRIEQLKENKKKLEELKLKHISTAFHEATATPKRSPGKSVKRKAPEPEIIRRSARVASLPEQPKYQNDDLEKIPKIRRRTFSSKRMDLLNRVYATDEERGYAVNKAAKLEGSLTSGFPTFVKPMLQSHVTGGFWLGLPRYFCRKHMPKQDTNISLIDENEAEFDTLYLARKQGLSAGWRGFAVAHELVDGDALIFQQTSQTTFKVYIVRASGYHDQ